MNEQIDEMQSRENAAEAMMDRMTEGLPSGMFRCDCGRVASLDAAVSATANPYSPPICLLCAEEITKRGNEQGHTKEPWILMMSDNATPHIMQQGALDIKDLKNLICHMPAEIMQSFNSSANARRIVACVNACHGMGTEVLEAGGYGPNVEEFFSAWSALPAEAHELGVKEWADTLLARVAVLEGALKNIIELVEHRDPHASRWPDMENARSALQNNGVSHE